MVHGLARFLIAISVCLTTAALAGAFDDGVAAYRRGDHETAANLFRAAAENGEAKAQAALGSMYYRGKGVPKNEQEAANWFSKAAEQGHVNAQFAIGVMYSAGTGVPKNDQEAAKWYRKAADQGHAKAQNNLGRMYLRGEGVPEDEQTAYFWYILAAEQGNESAREAMQLMEKYLSWDKRAQAQADASAWKPVNGIAN